MKTFSLFLFGIFFMSVTNWETDSNYDLSKFNINFYGAGFRIAPPAGVFKMQHLNMLELRYRHYTKTTGMNSDIISMNLKFK